MKIRTAIVALTLLTGGAATTFAGERRVDTRDRGDRHEVAIRHDDRNDMRHDRDFRRDDFPVIRYNRGCTIAVDR